VLASDYSEDGITFPPLRTIFAADLALPFSRGWVHLSTHNHATIKYEYGDAWIARWDNVGFDGPVIDGWREYEIPHALTPATLDGTEGINVGYRIGDVDGSTATCCPDAAAGPLVFEDVDLTDVVRARLSFSSYYLNWRADFAGFTLRYRFNGRAYVDRPLTPGEITALTTEGQIGAMTQVVEVPLSELRDGTNALEIVSANVPLNYPPALANVDLILTTR
jgi:hypothetical protein